MKMNSIHSRPLGNAMRFVCVILFCGACVFAQKLQSNNGVLDAVTPTPNLYPADANATREIEEAKQAAAEANKRILLVFGGNWCYDCHVLDKALHEGEAGQIVSESFLLIHVDIGEGEKNLDLVKLYKVPLDRGVPAVAILDATGKLLYSSGEGQFEAARRMMKKDLVAFLQKWRISKQPKSRKTHLPSS